MAFIPALGFGLAMSGAGTAATIGIATVRCNLENKTAGANITTPHFIAPSLANAQFTNDFYMRHPPVNTLPNWILPDWPISNGIVIKPPPNSFINGYK